MEMETLQDLYIEELKDLYSAENQILQALPRMIKAATHPALKKAFTLLERQTRRVVGQRNGDRRAILVEELELAGIEIETEKIDGLLLPLRPMALAADIGANRRKCVEAAAGDQGLDKDDNDEWPDEPEKTGAGVCLRKLHRASMEIAMTPVNLPAG